MAEILVVADDLTGANACAAGFARSGLRAVTVGLDRKVESISEFHSQFDAVVATTESRHIPPAEAERAVSTAIEAGWPVSLACARIDTTLRGNVGVAAKALIETVTRLSGKRAVGLCMPAFPEAGRVTIGGQQLLEGKRLEDTELAHDVRSPMRTSSVRQILQTNTELKVGRIKLSLVTGPTEELHAALGELLCDDSLDVIVGDALIEAHIDTLARAAVAVADQFDVRICGIDPGPASLALAKAMGLTESAGVPPVLAVSGSSTDLTIRQLRRLKESGEALIVPAILDGDMPDIVANAKAIADALNARTHPIVCWASVLHRSDVRELPPEDAKRLPQVIGEIVRLALTQAGIDGLYTTGGDITAAVLSALRARGIEVEDQVLPLAVLGEIVGGARAGTPIVTKGGLIGDDNGAVVCISQLRQMCANRRRWVRTIPQV